MKKLIIALCLLLLASLAVAGTLAPVWEDWTVLASGIDPGAGASGSTEIGTINMGNHYAVQVAVNVDETGDNPTGETGVSVYFVSGTTKATVSAIPSYTQYLSAADYTNYFAANGSGVTLPVLTFENVALVSIRIAKSLGTDNPVCRILYRRMAGSY